MPRLDVYKRQPYNNTVEVSDSAVKYVRAQFDNAIHELEKLTGKKFDEKMCIRDSEYDDPAFFIRVGEIGKMLGFSWGGDWGSFPDRPHFQWEMCIRDRLYAAVRI